jgi:hypothetical protein
MEMVYELAALLLAVLSVRILVSDFCESELRALVRVFVLRLLVVGIC